MTIIDLPFSQLCGDDPNPKLGAPRVRRVDNAYLEDNGRIIRTPGWEESSISATLTRPLWGNPDHVLDYNDTTAVAQIYTKKGSTWSDSTTGIPVVGAVERIQAMPIGNVSHNYGTVLKTAAGFVVVTLDDSGDIQYQPFHSPADSTHSSAVKVTRGSPGVLTFAPPRTYTWIGAAGDFLVAATASDIYVLEWNPTTLTFDQRWTVAGTGPCALDCTSTDVFLITAAGHWYRVLYTGGAWTTAADGTFSGTTTPMSGGWTCSIDVDLNQVAIGYIENSGVAYLRFNVYPDMSGGSWLNCNLLAPYAHSPSSRPRVAIGSVASQAVFVSKCQNRTEIGVMSGGSTIIVLLNGIIPTTSPVLVRSSATHELYLFVGFWTAGAYSQTCLCSIARRIGYTPEVGVIAVMGRGAVVANLGINFWIDNLVTEVLTYQDELGPRYSVLFGLPWNSSVAGVGLDVGAAEVGGSSWVCGSTRRPISFGQNCLLGTTRMWAGGCPALADCERVEDMRHFEPRSPTLADDGTGSIPAAGSYSYCCTFHFRDAAGNEYQTSPSAPAGITCSGGRVNVTVLGMPWTGFTGPSLLVRGWAHVWRTAKDGTTYRRLTDADGLAISTTAVVYADTTNDTILAGRPMLYTQGARGFASGRLATWAAPAHTMSAAGTERAIVGGLEQSNRVQLSDVFWAGEGVGWPDGTAFQIDLPSDVTGVAALGSRFLVATRSTWYIIGGMGPDAAGVGTFDAPEDIGAPCGPIDPRGVVATDAGIVYQGTDGSIYLIDRGSLQVKCVSDSAKSWVDRPTTDPVTGSPTRFVTVAACDQTLETAYLQESTYPGASSPTYPIVVFDTKSQQLYRDTGVPSHTAVGDIPLSGFVHGGTLYLSRSSGTTCYALTRRAYTSADTGKDRNGAALTTLIETSTISPAGMAKWCGLRMLWAHTSVDGLPTGYQGGGLSVLLSFDGYETTEETMTASEATSIEGLTSYQFCPARQKCCGFRVALSDSTTGKTKAYHGISFDIEDFDTDAKRGRSGSARAP